MQTAVREGRYLSAGQLASDFIKLSSYVEHKKGVFTGEVLEALYLQLDRELRVYTVPKQIQNELKEKMIQHMEHPLTSYQSNSDPLDILVDMRYDVTIFQSTARTQYNQKRRSHRVLE